MKVRLCGFRGLRLFSSRLGFKKPPPCLGAAEDSSSTCDGHITTEGRGWMRLLKFLKALQAGGGIGQ
jgi:hypothetical protein